MRLHLYWPERSTEQAVGQQLAVLVGEAWDFSEEQFDTVAVAAAAAVQAEEIAGFALAGVVEAFVDLELDEARRNAQIFLCCF